mmetsp:Transcript_10764/g.12409  ORF Transcript_10764/g.12409 Transcript_10764/m.12409 type:complete len:168 (+) Transcript_10764:109-612(+)
MIKVYKEQAEGLLLNLERNNDSAARGSDATASSLKELERILKVIRIESRTLGNSDREKEILESWIVETNVRLQDVKRKLLLDSRAESATRTNHRRFETATKNLENSTETLVQAKRIMAETEAVGLQIQYNMSEQRETLEKTQNRTENVLENLGLSDQLVKRLSRWWR